MTPNTLTQSHLKEILHYDPETGIFTWRKQVARRTPAGSIAGATLTGYRVIKIKGKGHRAHRLAWLYMTGKRPKCQIDHINHDGLDNRFANLREVDNQQNQRNQPPQKNSNGIMGVNWHKNNKKWCAHITVNKKMKHLGSFDDLIEAVCVRKSAEREYGFHPNHGLDTVVT